MTKIMLFTDIRRAEVSLLDHTHPRIGRLSSLGYSYNILIIERDRPLLRVPLRSKQKTHRRQQDLNLRPQRGTDF